MSGLRMVETADDAAEFMRWLSEKPYVALDTETTGVDPREPGFGVRLIQFGDTNTAWVFRLDMWRGLAKQAIERFRGRIVIHNARFDIAALAVEQVHVPWYRVDDTMIAMRLAEPTKSAALKEAATRHIAPGAATAQANLHEAMHKNKWTWADVPFEFFPYVMYAGMDVVLTSRLYEHEVCRRGLGSPVYDLEMDVLRVCTGMIDTGFRIDRPYCEAHAKALRDKTQSLKEMVDDRWGISIGSNDQIARALLDGGAMLTETTASGRPSAAKSQLTKFIGHENPDVADLAKAVLEYRKADKLAGSYLESFLYYADDDGIMHPDIETLAARTGRMSIRRPGLQTLPKPGESEDSRLVRSAVVPLREGDVLVSADYEQIEMRLAADFSGDDALIAAFIRADESGDDFFAEMGKIVYSDPAFTKADPRRKIVKNTMYGMLYGAGPAKLSETAGITLAEAQDARAAILGAFPGLSRAMTRFEREARETGTITTIAGRVLEVDSDAAYKGLNAAIQGSAADLFKAAMVRLAHAGLDDYMLIPVHDEVLFSVPHDQLTEVQDVIAANMLIKELRVAVPAAPSGALERWGDDK